MERNSFKEYSVLAMMSKEEQQPMKAQCEPTVEPKLRESQHDKYKTLPSSREHFTNFGNGTRHAAAVNITGFESAGSNLALLASVETVTRYVFRCFIHTCCNRLMATIVR